jgi:hypothetical protein
MRRLAVALPERATTRIYYGALAEAFDAETAALGGP